MNEDDNTTESTDFIQNDDDELQFMPIKRRRSSSNEDQKKNFETFTKTIRDNQSKKLEMFEKVLKPQTELELFFASMCKTCEKFNPIEQAKIKMEVSRLVSQMEMEHLQNNIANNEDTLYGTYSIESIPIDNDVDNFIEYIENDENYVY